MASPIILTIASVFKSAGLNQARTALLGANKDFATLASGIGKAAGAFGAFQAITSSRDFIVNAVEDTQRFERNMLALKQVFEGVTPVMANFTKEVESYGLSQGQAAQASVFLGSVLKQYGFSIGESSEQTQRLVVLAQDLATTFGYDVQDALLAITALFRGEYDPIEKFGVAMKQNEINAYLLTKGLGNLEGQELANAQATARLELLFDRAGDSMGAFSRASDTLYVAQSRLTAITENISVAFGAPLQQPIADITNLFADLAKEHGPAVVKIATAIGDALVNIGPLFVKIGESVILLVVNLLPLVELFGGLLNIVGKVLTPAFEVLNTVLGFTATVFDTVSAAGGYVVLMLDRIDIAIAKSDFGVFIAPLLEKLADLGGSFDTVETAVENIGFAFRARTGDFATFSTGARGVSAALRATRNEARHLASSLPTPELTYFQEELQLLGLYSKDAEGELSGIAGLFDQIAEAAAKSEASKEFELMGFNASQIAYFLTKPDWAEIFGNISRLAKIAALDINMMGYGASILFFDQIKDANAALAVLRAEAFGGAPKPGGGTGKAEAKKEARDYVKEFYASLQEEVMKQTATLKLKSMGASDGLIGEIIGSDDWLKIWIKIKQGVIVLDELQEAFNKTATGAKELEDAIQAWYDYDEAVQAVKDTLVKTIAGIREQGEALKLTFSDLLGAFTVLPTIEAVMGRFETAVVAQLESIERSLLQTFRNGDIFEAGYNELRKFAAQELQVLRAIQRQRDDLASRYTLSEALISEYRTALTGALSLTSLFGQLKTETEKRTVTEVTQGVARLSGSLREFNITVTKSYEETIDKVIDKSGGLLDGFREMAVKARAFGDNLQRLRALGLDPMLFDQLVSAGVEAGGQTAQALVEGGSATISEINGLFAEINTIGANLGEEVAATLYGTGIDLANGLLEGIRSEQDKLENLARTMADAFNAAFQSRINVQIDSVTAERVGQATADAQAQIDKIEVPSVPRVNPELQKLDALIAGATKALSGQLSSASRAGVAGKLGGFEALRQDIVSGSASTIGGLTRGLSSAEAQAIARGTGGQVVNNYYNVTAPVSNSRVDSYSNGQTFATGLATFNASNKNLTTQLTGV